MQTQFVPPPTLKDVAIWSTFKERTKNGNRDKRGDVNGNKAPVVTADNNSGNGGLGLPNLTGSPTVETIREQAAEIRKYSGSAARSVADAVRLLTSIQSLSGIEQEIAATYVESSKKTIEAALGVTHPLVREEMRTAFALAKFGCCAPEKDAVEDLFRELCVYEILKKGKGPVIIELWGHPYLPALKEVNAHKVRKAAIDLVNKTDSRHTKQLEQSVNALLKRGTLKPSDLLAGTAGLASFYVPGKNIPGAKSLSGGWILVELVIERTGRMKVYIREAAGAGIKKYAQKIMDRGTWIAHYALSWQVFTLKFEDREKTEMLCALHDWFRRGLAHEMSERAKRLSSSPPEA